MSAYDELRKTEDIKDLRAALSVLPVLEFACAVEIDAWMVRLFVFSSLDQTRIFAIREQRMLLVTLLVAFLHALVESAEDVNAMVLSAYQAFHERKGKYLPALDSAQCDLTGLLAIVVETWVMGSFFC